MTRHTHTEDFTEQGAAPMRDLIDRAHLVQFMESVAQNMTAIGQDESYVQGYMAALGMIKTQVASVRCAKLLAAAKRYDAINETYDEDDEDAMNEWRAARLELKSAIALMESNDA